MSDTQTGAERPMNAASQELIRVKEGLDARLPQLLSALPPQISADKFARVILTAVQMEPKLLTMDRRSLWNAAMRAAQDGLLPDGREGALVPYRGIVQWMPMVAGYRKKVRQSGEIRDLDVAAVYAKDKFTFERGDNPKIEHTPYLDGDPGPLVAVYSVATYNDGTKSREVMTREQVEEVRNLYAQKNREGEFSPMWRKSFAEAAKKTVFRRHSKVLPMNTDVLAMIKREDDEQSVLNREAPQLASPVSRSDLGASLDALAASFAADMPSTPEPEAPPDYDLVTGVVHEAAPDRSAVDRAALLADLTAAGEAMAARGTEALLDWLEGDSLTGEEAAILPVKLVSLWKAKAKKADGNQKVGE